MLARTPMTCVEADHLDNYAGLAEIEAAFAASPCASPGRAAGRVRRRSGRSGWPRRPGSPAAGRDLRQEPARRLPGGRRGPARHDGRLRGQCRPAAPVPGLTAQVQLRVPGRHNALNATAVLATCLELGFPVDGWSAGWLPTAAPGAALEPRARPTGSGPGQLRAPSHRTGRRPRRGADIAEGGLAIFQPHLFSRTGSSRRSSARPSAAPTSLRAGCSRPARARARRHRGTGRSGRARGRAHFVPDRAAVPAAVAATAKPGDLVLTMGAGDVTALGQPVLDAPAPAAARRDERSGGDVTQGRDQGAGVASGAAATPPAPPRTPARPPFAAARAPAGGRPSCRGRGGHRVRGGLGPARFTVLRGPLGRGDRHAPGQPRSGRRRPSRRGSRWSG
jgi:UDP-N-acetylmuramate--alanine ligase